MSPRAGHPGREFATPRRDLNSIPTYRAWRKRRLAAVLARQRRAEGGVSAQVLARQRRAEGGVSDHARARQRRAERHV